MRSEFIGLKDGIPGYTQQPLQTFRRPGPAPCDGPGEPLSGMETALLEYFRRHAGRTLSREELAERVWKQRYFHGSRTIDQTVSKLRKKLQCEARILSVWSAGYRFEDPSGTIRPGNGFTRWG